MNKIFNFELILDGNLRGMTNFAKNVRSNVGLISRWSKIFFIIFFVGWLLQPASAKASTLDDLGYTTGLTLNGPAASKTVYFPLGEGTQGAVLTVKFSASGALTPRSSLTVSVNGVPLATLPDSATAAPVTLNIPARFTKGPFLQIGFAADQSVDDQDVCYDNDNPAVWTLVDPATSLQPSFTAVQGVGAIWQGLGAPLTISLPTQPTAGDIETALILSTALVERGIAPYIGGTPDNASIIINPAKAGLMVVKSEQGAAQLLVSNAAAARALVTLAPALRALPASSAASSFTPNANPDAGTVTFGSLGFEPAAIGVKQDAVMELPLPFAAIPAGRHAQALILYGRGSAVSQGETEIVSVEVGGNVVWSAAFQGEVNLDGQRVNLPEKFIASGAPVSLHIVRVRRNEACGKYAPLTFSLQDNSALVLGNGNAVPQRFAGFNVLAGGAVPVLTDLPPGKLPAAIPLVAELLGAAHANPVAVMISGTSNPPHAPFILISHQAGTVVSVAPIPRPTGKIILPLPNQEASAVFPDTANVSVLQLVSSGVDETRVPGLWLSPGPDASLVQAALPGDGNVAFYDGSSAPATFVTLLHDAVFITKPTNLIQTILRHWNAELLAAAWLILTILTVIIFVRRRRIK